MPEIPEIENYRKYIKENALDKTISKVEVIDEGVIKGTEAKDIRRSLIDNAFHEIKRIGKYLFLETKNGKNLEWHFGMTGLPFFYEDEKQPDYTRVLITFKSDLKLAFVDARKFGEMKLVKNMDQLIEDHNLGPDALTISEKKFIDLFSDSRSMVKSGLMNQSNICGIGNLYSDEILFQAGIYPKKTFNNLDEKKLKMIYSKSDKILKKAIEILQEHKIKKEYHKSGHEFPDSYLISHRSKNGNCPGCDERIKTMKIGGRTCYYCPKCQPDD